MSELTYVEIQKISASKLDVRINSFRDDALPNQALATSDPIKIKTTGLVMLANYIYNYKDSNKAFDNIYDSLLKMEGHIQHKKLSPSTVNYFIKEATVTSFYTIDGFVNIDALDIPINPIQRASLYQLQIDYINNNNKEELKEFLEEYPNSTNDFYIELLYLDQMDIEAIIGEDSFRKIQAHITISLEFNHASYITGFNEKQDYSFETSLDSHLYDWL